MKKILILGSGAREHVIGETLRRSGENVELFVFAPTKNPGLLELSSGYELGNLTDIDAIHHFAKFLKPDFVFPGPEAPIAAGVVDALAEAGIPSVAPRMTVARLESSKSFTRDLVHKYRIPGNPLFRVFDSEEGLKSYVDETLGGEFVVKADGLKSGKGVHVKGDHFQTVEEGLEYARLCIREDGQVVVEEKLIGQEFSLMSFVDGKTVLDMIPVQDHKRAHVNDEGPNTGGMGSYSDSNHLLPFLSSQDLQRAHDITVQVARALEEETGTAFQGIMYGGFMAVKNGVRLIEYNARFGDPEAMNVLCLLESNLVDVCEALIRGELEGMALNFKPHATVCKYVVPQGYPDHSVKDQPIELGPLPDGVKRYFASVKERDGQFVLAGSRALAFVGMGPSLEEAEQLAQQGAESVKGPVFFREDVGTKALIDRRVQDMKNLRG